MATKTITTTAFIDEPNDDTLPSSFTAYVASMKNISLSSDKKFITDDDIIKDWDLDYYVGYAINRLFMASCMTEKETKNKYTAEAIIALKKYIGK